MRIILLSVVVGVALAFAVGVTPVGHNEAIACNPKVQPC
jgi:hypothetical protein